MAAVLAPLAMEGAEVLGSSLLGREGLSGLKHLANTAVSMYSKENQSPSKLLHKMMSKGQALLSNPSQVKHVLEHASGVAQTALGAGSHLAGALNQAGILSASRTAKLQHGLGSFNHSFHHSLGKLGKLHNHLVPFLKQ